MLPPTDRPNLRIGQILAEDYRLTRLIGEGAMGFVYAARTLEGGELVAIKCLRPALAADRLAVERFRREIRSTMRLHCQYIARTLDVGLLGDGTPFMVMEHLEGSDLAHVIASRGTLAIASAIEYALETCLALAHAHRMGIVHRDIKPANLFLATSDNGPDQIKVLDFGISKTTNFSTNGSSLNLTGNAGRLGSPLYISPEQQTLAHDADPRADIWSLGITLFEMIAGAVPFDASPLSIRDRNEPPNGVPSLARYRADVPTGLDRVLARCLQRMPERRYQNVAELAEALSAFAPSRARPLAREVAEQLGFSPASGVLEREHSSIARGPNTVDGMMGCGSTLGPVTSRQSEAGPRRWRRRFGIGMAVTVLMVGIAAWLFVRRANFAQPSVHVFAASPPTATLSAATLPPATGPIEIPARAAARGAASGSSVLPMPSASSREGVGVSSVGARTKGSESTDPQLHSREIDPIDDRPTDEVAPSTEAPRPLSTALEAGPEEPRPDLGY